MSYRINRTDGELLIDLTDGIIDTTTTDITLVGKNYKGFGEILNENFVKILENFASTSQPTTPMIGQTWWDKQDNKLKVYDGESFKSAAGTVVSSTQPTNLTSGDLWIDNEANKLYLFDGTDLVLVGPEYDANQGQTGFVVDSQLDSTDVQRTILKLFLGGNLVGVYSPETFIIPTEFAIPSFPEWAEDTFFPKRQRLEKGFNVVQDSFFYRGTATSATALIDVGGNEKTAADFVPTSGEGEMTGSLSIKNSNGITVGVGDTQFATLKVTGTTTSLEMQQSNADFGLKVRSGSSFLNAIYIDSSETKIGIFKTNPTSTLDVSGDMRVTSNVTVDGNLLVNGDTTYFNTSTLRVEDKNIELGLLDDSTEGNDAAVDGGGITLRSSQGSKDIAWYSATNSWSINTNFDLQSSPVVTDPAIKFDGVTILTATELAPQVTVASGVTNLGTLVELNVDDININSATITRQNGSGLTIDPNGAALNLSGDKITNLGAPTTSTDATTKDYVDTQIDLQDVLLSIDATGLTDPNDINTLDGPVNSIASIVELMKSAASVENLAYAKVLVTSYANTTVSGINVTVTTDGTGTLQKSVIAVDSNGVQNESVVQDIAAANTASGVATLVTTRYLYTYQNAGGTWTFSSRSLIS